MGKELAMGLISEHMQNVLLVKHHDWVQPC